MMGHVVPGKALIEKADCEVAVVNDLEQMVRKFPS